MPFFGKFGANFLGIFGEIKLEMCAIFITHVVVSIS
jgi:hypothetical protein